MQGGRGGRHPFFNMGDPFAGFGGFGDQRGFMPSFFGGRDPFDDPFFTRPFGNMFESSFFGPAGSPFMGSTHASGFIENQPSQPVRSRGPVIEELNSDDEKYKEDANEKKDGSRKHARSSRGPYIEDPDDESGERKSKQVQFSSDFNRVGNIQSRPHTQSFTFQSSSVTYGGANGAYYTSSHARRSGSDGLTFEETKEADSSTGQASHRVSRGIQNKGHSVTRKLNSDGKVEKMQMVHNLNEDQLTGFEEAWKGKARKHLPGWNEELILQDGAGSSSGVHNGSASRGGWALPSTEPPQHSGNVGQRTIGGTPLARSDHPELVNHDARDTTSFRARSKGFSSNMDHIRRHRGA